MGHGAGLLNARANSDLSLARARLDRRAALAGGLAALFARRARASTGRIAAAASMRFVLPELMEAFGAELDVAFGASGILARQIARGAPFDLFLSANEAWAETLIGGPWAEGEGAVFATGELALVFRDSSAERALAAPADPREALEAIAREGKLAIANPEHAPYGLAAIEALEALGLRAALEPRLVLGENVGQAAQFLSIGAARGALIARSLIAGPIAELPALAIERTLHSPLLHRALLAKRAGERARRFYRFLRSADAAELLAARGLAAPPSDAP